MEVGVTTPTLERLALAPPIPSFPHKGGRSRQEINPTGFISCDHARVSDREALVHLAKRFRDAD
jgi:hypothetical protein